MLVVYIWLDLSNKLYIEFSHEPGALGWVFGVDIETHTHLRSVWENHPHVLSSFAETALQLAQRGGYSSDKAASFVDYMVKYWGMDDTYAVNIGLSSPLSHKAVVAFARAILCAYEEGATSVVLRP